MTLAQHPEVAWTLIALVVAAMVIGCLRVLGFESYNAIIRHNLRIEVRALRREQQRRLDDLARAAAEERTASQAANEARRTALRGGGAMPKDADSASGGDAGAPAAGAIASEPAIEPATEAPAMAKAA